MMINLSNGTPTDVLMDALAAVEDATEVVIIIERPGSVSLIANCGYRDIQVMLDESKYLTFKEMFDTDGE